jgi:hypothetical protein
MARGFESKDVEYQQDEAQKTRSRSASMTPAERDAVDGRKTLELMLARAEADLSAARSPAHRQMLERAIADLRSRLDRQ